MNIVGDIIVPQCQNIGPACTTLLLCDDTARSP